MSRASRTLKLPTLYVAGNARSIRDRCLTGDVPLAPAASAKPAVPLSPGQRRVPSIQVACLLAALGTAVISSERDRPTENVEAPLVSVKTANVLHTSSIPLTTRIPDPADKHPSPCVRTAVKEVPALTISRFPGPHAKASTTIQAAAEGKLPGLQYVHSSKSRPIPDRLLQEMFLSVPEVGLGSLSTSQSPRTALTETVREIIKIHETSPDAFPTKLQKERADLAGLPFIAGEACRLTVESARTLRWTSLELRQRPSQLHASFLASDVACKRAVCCGPAGLAALRQIAFAADCWFRLDAMTALAYSNSTAADRLLVEEAIFDTEAEVRNAALNLLKRRPKSDIGPVLVQGLRYPWLPAVKNAACAVTALKRADLIPQIKKLVDAPAPEAPYVDANDKRLKVRELVRINHHRNCLLCHPPAGSNPALVRDVPVGVIPVPGEPLPVSGGAYYTSDRDAVRADVTYLRQDFSVLLEVPSPGEWPAMQRYDFLVRVRDACSEDISPATQRNAIYQDVIRSVLRELTGKDNSKR